jgi:hypothetical protein
MPYTSHTDKVMRFAQYYGMSSSGKSTLLRDHLDGEESMSMILGKWVDKISYPLAGMDIATRYELHTHLSLMSEINIRTSEEHLAYREREHLRALKPLLKQVECQVILALILCHAVDDEEIKTLVEFDKIISPIFKKITKKHLLEHIKDHAWKDARKMGRARTGRSYVVMDSIGGVGPRMTKTDTVYDKCLARLQILSNNSIHFLLED